MQDTVCTDPAIGDWLVFYLLGCISAENRQKVEDHISSCAFCKKSFEAHEESQEDTEYEITLRLSRKAVDVLYTLSAWSGRSPRQTVRLAVSMLKTIREYMEQDCRVVILAPNGTITKEILIPPSKV